MNRPEKYDIYIDPMWDVIGAYPAEVRPATRWERLVLACRRAWAHVRV